MEEYDPERPYYSNWADEAEKEALAREALANRQAAAQAAANAVEEEAMDEDIPALTGSHVKSPIIHTPSGKIRLVILVFTVPQSSTRFGAELLSGRLVPFPFYEFARWRG